MTRKGTCTGIALYDLHIESLDIKGLFYWLENWFQKAGFLPTRVGIGGEGLKSEKNKTYKGAKKILESRDFEEIEDLWVGCPAPDCNVEALDSLLSAALNTSIRKKGFDLYFHNGVLPHSWEYCEELVREISQFVPAKYGIAFQRDFSKGPGFYVYGVIFGLDSYKYPEHQNEEKMITRWAHTYGDPDDWHVGLMRDVYPVNFLSEAHLSQDIRGTSLKNWIESSLDHGTLKPLTDTLWSWRVEEDKIPSVHNSLKDTGLLVCV